MNGSNPISPTKFADVCYTNAKKITVLWFFKSTKRVKGKFIAVAKTRNLDAVMEFAKANGLKVSQSASKHRRIYTVED